MANEQELRIIKGTEHTEEFSKQELLSDEARQDIAHLVNRFMGDHIRKAVDTGVTPPDGTGFIDEIDKLLKALGYKQVWTKCPDCDGVGFFADGNEGITINKADCPTCKSTGEKKLDSPELPEEIPALCVINMVEGRGYPRCIEPLIKDAREQERERYRRTLEGCLELLNINLEHNRGKVSFILEQALRALTGE